MKNFVIVLSIGGAIVFLALNAPLLGRWGAAFSNDKSDAYVDHYPMNATDKAKALAALSRKRQPPKRSQLVELNRAKREPHPITLKPGETLEHLAEWSGIPVKTIRAENELKVWDLPGVGRRLRITMDGRQTERFVVARSEFAASLEARFDEQWTLKRVEDYRIRSGDTIQRIVKRFGPPLEPWLVKKYNPAMNLSLLPEGRTLAVPLFKRRPKVAEKKRDDIVFSTETYVFVSLEARIGESLGLYSRWSGTPVEQIKTDNGLSEDQINLGQALSVRIFHKRRAPFEDARERYRKDSVRRLEDRFFKEHALKQDETLWGLATRYAVDYKQLKDYNSDKDFRRLSPGTRIRIPRTEASYAELQEQMNRMK